MEVIRNDMRACGVDTNIDRDMKGLEGKYVYLTSPT